MSLDTIEKIGVSSILIGFFVKAFHTKDIHQNNQNNILVENLIKSNENLTNKFEIVIHLLQEQSKVNSQIIKFLEEQNKNKKRNRKGAKK